MLAKKNLTLSRLPHRELRRYNPTSAAVAVQTTARAQLAFLSGGTSHLRGYGEQPVGGGAAARAVHRDPAGVRLLQIFVTCCYS